MPGADDGERDFWVGITAFGAVLGTGLYALVEHEWWFGGFYTIGGGGGLMWMSPAFRSRFGLQPSRVVVLAALAATWMFLATNISVSAYNGWFAAAPRVIDGFLSVYNDLRPRLGDPVEFIVPGVSTVGTVYIGGFEHGIVIWIEKTQTIYRIRDGLFKWEKRPHIDEAFDKKWWNPDYVKNQLRVPPDKLPVGGIAKEWAGNPDDWAWLGGLEWSCTVLPKNVMYQRFEYGFAIGGIPTGLGSPDGEVIAFLDKDDTWISERLPGKSTHCEEVSH